MNSFQVNEICTNHVFLAKVIVRLRTEHGYDMLARALIDQGSQATFLTQDVPQRLNKRPTIDSVTKIGQSGHTTIRHQAQVQLNAHFRCGLDLKLNALILMISTVFAHPNLVSTYLTPQI